MRIKKQEDIKDCGLYVLQYFVAKHNDDYIDINYFKNKVTYSSEGVNISTLKKLASEHDIDLNSYSGDFESLESLDNSNMPIALLLNRKGYSHYVVLEKMKDNYFIIQDSAYGRKMKVKKEDLAKEFANVILFFDPKEEKSKNRNKNYSLDNKISTLFSFKKYTYPLFISALLGLFLSFGSTFFIKIVFDFILPNYLKNNLIIIFVFFLWINILMFINRLFKNHVIKKIKNDLEFTLTKAFFDKIKRVPSNYLSKLTSNDYFKRLTYIKEICEFQSNFVFTFLSEIFSFIGSTILLIWINYVLFLIMFGIAIVVLLGNVIYHFWIEKNYPDLLEKNLNNMKSDIDFIYSWKEMDNVDYSRFISKNQFKNMLEFKKKEYSFAFKDDIKNFWNDLFIGNFSTIIVFASSFFILKNKLSTGSLMMFLNGINFFINPMLNMSSLLLSQTMIKRNVNLVNFVLNLDEKNNLDTGLFIDKIKKIELENVNFYYENGKNILNIPSFTIDQNIQLNGKNGSGKTTMLSFINGCFKCYLGKMKINDIDFDSINLINYQSKNILINSSSHLPDVSFLEYITSNNENYKNELNKNIQKYGLYKIFEEMNFNLNGSIISNGSNLSSGQKQLLLLLKLFARKYDLIMLDEAFENINPSNCELLKKAIKKYQEEALFIEISHNKNYLFKTKEVCFEKINNCF